MNKKNTPCSKNGTLSKKRQNPNPTPHQQCVQGYELKPMHCFIYLSATTKLKRITLPEFIATSHCSFGFRKAASMQMHHRQLGRMKSATAHVSLIVTQMVFRAMPHNSWLVFAFLCDWQVHTSTGNFNLSDRRLVLYYKLNHQKFLTFWGKGCRLQSSIFFS